MEGVDDQLDVYKKDIDYKLSQIQLSANDIDTLEKSLRAAMNEIQNRVLVDFDSFTDSQKQKHNEFSQRIKEDAESIEAKIRFINDSIEDLQITATGSMKEKLSEFQNTFDMEISNKNILLELFGLTATAKKMTRFDVKKDPDADNILIIFTKP